MDINPRLPTELNLTIASVNEAIEYWLQNAVLKPDVKVAKVTWYPNDHIFTVTLDRESPGD